MVKPGNELAQAPQPLSSKAQFGSAKRSFTEPNRQGERTRLASLVFLHFGSSGTVGSGGRVETKGSLGTTWTELPHATEAQAVCVCVCLFFPPSLLWCFLSKPILAGVSLFHHFLNRRDVQRTVIKVTFSAGFVPSVRICKRGLGPSGGGGYLAGCAASAIWEVCILSLAEWPEAVLI